MNDYDMFIKIATDSWKTQVKATNGILEKLTDAQLEQEIAPGKNRGTYLLGHLTSVHDLMLPLLRFEDALYPELKPAYVDAPDKTITIAPGVAQLRAQWKDVNDRLQSHLDKLTAGEWLARHASVSEEDFAKEPHRNRLNVLASRTAHLSYHNGQLALLVKKN